MRAAIFNNVRSRWREQAVRALRYS